MINITHLSTPGSLRAWLEDAVSSGQTHVALDLETSGLTRTDKIISAAVTGPTANDVAFFGPEMLHELLDAPGVLHYLFHNASFDLRNLAWAGVHLHSRFTYSDTLILSHLLDESGEHGLGSLVERYFKNDYKARFWQEVREKYGNKVENVPQDKLAEYNAKDVHYTLRLYRDLEVSLASDGVPRSLVEHVHSLQRSLLETEINGIAVDQPYLLNLGVQLKTRIETLLPKMRESVAGEISLIECDEWVREINKRKTPRGRAGVKRPEFSFDSAKQLAVLLYDNLQLPEQKNEKTKNVSVDYDSLEKIKDRHPLVAMIQEYREYQKVYSTYIQGTLDRMVDGRIYPSLNVCGTVTGRISHSNPNMGNMPAGGGIRGMFIPDSPDDVFVTADFKQLEICVAAHFTKDPNLLKIVNEGASMHDITAAGLGIKRDLAKTLNFAMGYGCSYFKVAKTLGVSNEEGKKAFDRYWETYSGQKRVMDDCAKLVDEGKFVLNPFGRRRRFEKRERKAWDQDYRKSFNALIQGTGSDLTSRALYLTDQALRSRGIGKALFSVHDEILCQVKRTHWEEAQKILTETMSAVGKEIELIVELKAEPSGPCDRWLD